VYKNTVYAEHVEGTSFGSKRSMNINKNMTCMYAGMHECMPIIYNLLEFMHNL